VKRNTYLENSLYITEMEKMKFDVTQMRQWNKIMAPTADFEAAYIFFYDETNNIRKFYVREEGFNYDFEGNFVLGGIVTEDGCPDLGELFNNLNLQNSINEVKLKHIAKGDFLQCVTSKKLNTFLKHLWDNGINVHYSTVNLLFWSIADIVDSAIINSEVSKNLPPQFAMKLKNDLYSLAKLEIEAVIELFHKYKYPNISETDVLPFIEELTSLFHGYIDQPEFHFGLESLRQILKESKKKNSLPFIQDEEDHILVRDFSQFYLRPLYSFKNSTHILDNEVDIANIISNYELTEGDESINNYSFEDSVNSSCIQVSDIFIGLVGKFSKFINTSTPDQIKSELDRLNEMQKENISLMINIINRSIEKNIAFVHSVDAFSEMEKVSIITQDLEI